MGTMHEALIVSNSNQIGMKESMLLSCVQNMSFRHLANVPKLPPIILLSPFSKKLVLEIASIVQIIEAFLLRGLASPSFLKNSNQERAVRRTRLDFAF